MLKIRLMKPGKSIKRRYHFKIVVMEDRRARDSKFVDELGYYNPACKLLKVDIEKYEDWIKKGAQPTDKAQALYKRYKRELSKKGEKDESQRS